MNKKEFKNFISYLLAVLVLLQFCVTVFADETNQEIYVNDIAEVLSAEEEAHINNISHIIFEQTNCKLFVAAVDFLEGKSIEQYSADLYMQNEMGSNGLLAVFSVAEENYYVIQGTELVQEFSNDQIDELLQNLVEQDFENQNYDKAIMSFYQAAAEKVSKIYSAIIDPEQYSAWLEEQRLIKERQTKEQGRWFAAFVASIALTSVFMSVMIVMVALRSSNKRKHTNC